MLKTTKEVPFEWYYEHRNLYSDGEQPKIAFKVYME